MALEFLYVYKTALEFWFDHVRDARDEDFVWHQFLRKKLWQELSGNIFLLMHREVNRRLRA